MVYCQDVASGLIFSTKTMAESDVMHNDNIIVPHNFEANGLWSSSEESDSG